MLPEKGETKGVFEEFENPGYMIFRNRTYLGPVNLGFGSRADYKNVFFLLDKTTGKNGIIRSYYDDLIKRLESNIDEETRFPKSLPDENVYVLYYPHELLQINRNESSMRNFPTYLYRQLNDLVDKMKETDNPVILFGKPKTPLSILFE